MVIAAIVSDASASLVSRSDVRVFVVLDSDHRLERVLAFEDTTSF